MVSSNNVKMSCPNLADSRVSDACYCGYYANSKLKQQSCGRKVNTIDFSGIVCMSSFDPFFAIPLFFSLTNLNIKGNLKLAYSVYI